MENELIENNSLNEYFKIEYEYQNLNDNPSYIKWKKLIITLKGKDTRFVKCKKDNIIFPCTKKSLLKYPEYQSKCPVCEKDICYYCSIQVEDSYEKELCCVKRRTSCILVQNGFAFINPIGEEQDYYPLIFSIIFKFVIIPIFSLLFIAEKLIAFFYKLKLKGGRINQNDYIHNYEQFKGGHRLYSIIILVVINIAFAVIIIIPCILLIFILLFFC